jgi:putative membrane protein
MERNFNRHLYLFIFTIGLILSGIQPKDMFTWFLEVFPAILGMIILIFTYQKFQFSSLTYWAILIHCYILFIGGHYTYAEVPLFDWIRDEFHLERNNYDKIGHFAQGFVPSLIARELFIRLEWVKKGMPLFILTLFTALAISALYELLEWAVALGTGESADAFLGTQGYIWDTQSDMFMAMLGSISMLLLFSNWQDKSILEENISNLT